MRSSESWKRIQPLGETLSDFEGVGGVNAREHFGVVQQAMQSAPTGTSGRKTKNAFARSGTKASGFRGATLVDEAFYGNAPPARRETIISPWG